MIHLHLFGSVARGEEQPSKIYPWLSRSLVARDHFYRIPVFATGFSDAVIGISSVPPRRLVVSHTPQ